MPRSFPPVASFIVLLAVMADYGSAATIDVGHHTLLPNTPGQIVPIMVSGGDEVAGFNLFAQVGDGGPELSDFGHPPGTDGPTIAAVDLKLDTIFADVSGPQDDQTGIPQVAISSIEFSTPGESTIAEGLLLSLTIDTTGFVNGSWDLLLDGVLPMFEHGPFHTDFAGIPATILNGTLEVTGALPGDFDVSGVVDVADIDLLHDALRANSTAPIYDVDQTGSVDSSDLTHLVEVILGTFYGDANLSGSVDALDLNAVGIHWRTNDVLLSWGDGDFNGDRSVDALDLNLLALNWRATNAVAASVPEPATSQFILLVLLAVFSRRARFLTDRAAVPYCC